MTTEEIMKLFMDCCSKETVRYDLSLPFIQGNIEEEYVYATDGRVLVRTAVTPELREIVAPMMVDRQGR